MTSSDLVWHVTFSAEAPYMNMYKRNLLTNPDNHRSFSLGQVGFWVNWVKIYILTSSDPKKISIQKTELYFMKTVMMIMMTDFDVPRSFQ